LYLGEKHYENIVDAFTNNVINTGAASHNPKPASPLSSSTFLNPSSPSDNFRIQESEYFHSNKGDIAD
jgi:hypothetical protein